MLYLILLAGTFVLVATSPAPQPFDFASVDAAPSPSFTGPPFGVASQTGVYNQAAAFSSASAAVMSVAIPSATASAASRRDILPGLLGLNWRDPDDDCETSRSTTTTTTRCESTSTTSTTTTTAPAPTITVPSTCTPVSWTNTNSYTSESSCPTPFEVGTYCGFVNPEDPCAVQPGGSGPHVTPDTVAAFEAYEPYHRDALDAVTPASYVETFKNLNASVNANSYLGYEILDSYDVEGCATFCDNTNLCTGFNIYIERDPSINPDQCSCSNPASITNYKCSIWGSGVDAAAATNYGQTRDNFQVVIVASNGYEKTNTTIPSTPSGWTNPRNCSSAAHNHPSTCIGQKFFPGPFDVGVCAAYARAQNIEQKGSGSWWMPWAWSYSKCNFFNAFMLTENGIAKGTYCSLFTQQYEPSLAFYEPGWDGDVYWGVESSWSFCLA